jgi:hypothetical protein
MQPQPRGGELAGDSADLAAGLAAHAAQPNQRRGDQLDAGLLVQADAPQMC